MWGGGGGGEGRSTVPIYVLISCLFKNDQNNKDDIILIKDNLKFIFIEFKQHRNRKCPPFIKVSNQNVKKKKNRFAFMCTICTRVQRCKFLKTVHVAKFLHPGANCGHEHGFRLIVIPHSFR